MESNTSTKDLEQRVKELSDAINIARNDRSSGPYRPSHGSHRSAPYHLGYGAGRGRGAYGAASAGPGPHRNRTLIIHPQPQPPSGSGSSSGETGTPAEQDSGWVSKRDRHMQLINKSVYDKMSLERTNEAPVSSLSAPSTPNTRGPAGAASMGHGVTNQPSHRRPTAKNPPVVKTELCRTFSSTGQCRRGPSCKYLHDASKIAICKEFLSKGNCTNDACRYAHVKVNPNGPICAAFASCGYCEKGAECSDRHDFECPDYSLKGSCPNPRCRLPHIDRAGQLRQANQPDQTTTNPSKSPTKASGSEAVVEETMTTTTSPESEPSDTVGNEQGFTQQENYVSLDVDPAGQYEHQFKSGSKASEPASEGSDE